MDADRLLRRGLYLEYVTLGWNVVGTGVCLAAAVAAGSAALAGFGLDSAIEIFASVVVVWQLRGCGARGGVGVEGSAIAVPRGTAVAPVAVSPSETSGEGRALRLIGGAFLALAVYVFLQAGWTLWAGARPAPSGLGMVWLGVTCGVMLLLAWGKLATGRALGNAVLMTEARVTLIDAALAGAVLVGVGCVRSWSGALSRL